MKCGRGAEHRRRAEAEEDGDCDHAPVEPRVIGCLLSESGQARSAAID